MKKILLLIILLLLPKNVFALNYDFGIVGSIQVWGSDNIPEGYVIADGREVKCDSEYAQLCQVLGKVYGGDGKDTIKLPNLMGKVAVGVDGNDSDFGYQGKSGGSKTATVSKKQMAEHTHVFVGSEHTHSVSDISVTSGNPSTAPTATFSGKAGTTSSAGSHSHSARYDGLRGADGTSSNTWWARRNASASDQPRDDTSPDGTNSGGSHTHTYKAAGTITLSSVTHTHSVSTTATVGASQVSGTNAEVGSGQAHNNIQPYITMYYIIKYK